MNEETKSTTNPEPKLKVPPSFTESELIIEGPTGIPIKFIPKKTTKGREEFRWSYPSMIEDTSKVKSEEAVASYMLMLTPDRIKVIIEEELDYQSQYYWRLSDGDVSKFTEYFKTGKSQREIISPDRLNKEAMKLHKEAMEAKKQGDMAVFKDKLAKSKELKQKAIEILTKEINENEEEE